MKIVVSRARLSALSLACLSLCASVAHAQTPSPESQGSLKDTVVVATRQAQRVDDLIANIVVLDRSDLDRAGTSTLAEVLSQTAGIEMSRTGGRGAQESLFIRGANSGHTLVLVDGVRVGSATMGSTALESIPLSAIERIEVLRGPASALYGSDAIGGVIQVITKPGSGATGLSASAGLGTMGTYETSVAYANRVGAWTYSIKAGAAGTQGINSVITPTSQGYNADKDGFRGENINITTAYALSAYSEVGAGLFRWRHQQRYDGYQFDPITYDSLNAGLNYKTAQDMSGAHLYWKAKPTTAWTTHIKLAQGVDRSEQPSSTVGEANNMFKTTQDQYSWQNDIRLPVGQALVLVERLEQRIASTQVYDRQSRGVNSIALGWTGQIDRHSLQANTRWDENSQYGTHQSNYLGYGYALTDAWSLTASAGSAFKAPTMNDLYYPYVPYSGYGNPNLKPEESLNKEAGVRFNVEGFEAHAQYFDNRITNLIQWEDDGTFAYTPRNVGRAHIKGLEAGARKQWHGWLFAANMTLQSPKNESDDSLLPRRARRFGTVSVNKELEGYRFGVEVKTVGRRYDNPSSPLVLAGYSLVNLTVDKKLSPQWQVFARIDNLFDKKYETARSWSSWSGTTQWGVPGVSAFVGVRYNAR